MKFSIIIPIKNSEETLQWCLQSVMLQAGEDDYEVICVDNGSSDGSVGIVERFRDKYPKKIKLLHSSASTVSGVRNAGAKESKGEFLAFLDSDCIAPAWWLKKASERIKEGWDALGGWGRTIAGMSKLIMLWNDSVRPRVDGKISWIPSCDLFIRRRLFNAIGGFSEQFVTTEDVEFCSRVKKAGVEIGYFSDLDVVHLGEPKNLWDFFKKEVWRGKGVLRLFLKTKGRVGGKPLLLALYSIMYLLVSVTIAVKYGVFHLMLSLLLGFVPLLGLGYIKTRNWLSGLILGGMYFVYGLARAIAVAGGP